ncbi:MAG: nicotinate phosphoribosyltransferase, partial [Calditrichia bacterium]|nr:nicotinate phosphoribosyltransferase [Calditrichia bacterium]
TSNVMAGKEFGIPIFGTAAHSWIMAFRDELKSFEAFHITFPESTILLVDTYGTEKGIENAIKVGNKIKGIRIDSGNLLEESIKARKQLDDAGMQNVKIVLSGDLDEYKIKDLIENNSPADSYGVGTRLSVSSDAPYLGGIYKLVQLEQENNTFYTAKFSKNKTTYPGKKQIFRQRDKNEIFSNDIIGLNNEEIEGEKLLYQVFLNGKRTQPKTNLKTIQEYCRKQLANLPEQLLNITYVFNVNVKYSSSLNDLLAFLSGEENSLNG